MIMTIIFSFLGLDFGVESPPNPTHVMSYHYEVG
jgi:hypothetical protein